MKESPQLQRALVLQQQGRHALAEKELRQHLAQAPNDGFGHALLAISLVELERLDQAEHAASEAIGNEPDTAFAHYAMARVLSARHRDDDALHAVREAIRLEPSDPDYHGMHAAIEFDRRHWQEALDAAETGLQFDAEHTGCNNLRAMALVKLGRKAEAGATIDRTLARDPDNAFSHANQGWTLLEQGRRKEAMHHFRESLRLDPSNDWARAGLVEGLKAGNPLYAVMLKYFLWMQKLPSNVQWGIIIGGYVANRFVTGMARSNAELAPWLLPVRILYVVFVVFTWLAYPIFNLMLFLHPVGRYALNGEQRAQAIWVGLCLGLGAISLGAFVTARDADYLVPALVFGLLAIPTAAVFSCQKGWPRLAMAGITLILAAVGLGAIALISFIHPEKNSSEGILARQSLVIFLVGTFISQWVANWLAQQRPTR